MPCVQVVRTYICVGRQCAHIHIICGEVCVLLGSEHTV